MTFKVGCTYLDNEGIQWIVEDRVNHVLLITMSGVPDVAKLAIDEDGEKAAIRHMVMGHLKGLQTFLIASTESM